MKTEKLKRIVEEILKEDGFEFDKIVEVSKVENTENYLVTAGGHIPNPAKIVFYYTAKKKVDALNKKTEKENRGFLYRLFKYKEDLYLDSHVFEGSIQDGRLIQYLLEKI